jgi:hypothetical protein
MLFWALNSWNLHKMLCSLTFLFYEIPKQKCFFITCNWCESVVSSNAGDEELQPVKAKNSFELVLVFGYYY